MATDVDFEKGGDRLRLYEKVISIRVRPNPGCHVGIWTQAGEAYQFPENRVTHNGSCQIAARRIGKIVLILKTLIGAGAYPPDFERPIGACRARRLRGQRKDVNGVPAVQRVHLVRRRNGLVNDRWGSRSDFLRVMKRQFLDEAGDQLLGVRYHGQGAGSGNNRLISLAGSLSNGSISAAVEKSPSHFGTMTTFPRLENSAHRRNQKRLARKRSTSPA